MIPKVVKIIWVLLQLVFWVYVAKMYSMFGRFKIWLDGG